MLTNTGVLVIKKNHRVTIPCKRSFDFTWNLPDFMKSVWNPPDFMKSVWNLYEIHWISWNPYEICQISWNPYEIQWISWNPADFRWNPPKLKCFCWNIWIYKVLGGFHMKSTGFHEIHMKSSGFHEIWQISCEIHPNWRVFAETSEFIRFWVDFMVKSARFQVKSTRFQIMSFCVMIKYRSFDFWKTNQMFQQKLFWLVFWKMKDLYLIITQKLIILKSGGFHADFMWNQVDFMKSLVIAPTLHSSNWRVFAETLAFIILGGFHRWNLGELCWISQVKLGEIHQISGWNPLDFKGEIPHPAFIKLKSFC